MTPLVLDSPDIPALCRLLASRKYQVRDELALQNGIEAVLQQAGLRYSREHVLDAQSRPDFLLGNAAIEVKTQGSVAQLLRQGHRYLQHPQVPALIVIGTPSWLNRVPSELAGKPVFAVRLLNSLL